MENKKTKILLVSSDNVASTMAGPGIRYFEMAKALASFFSVTLAVPNECDLKDLEFKITQYDSKFPNRILKGLITKNTVVVAQNLPPSMLFRIRKLQIIYIADLYDPSFIEVLEYAKYDSLKNQKLLYDFNLITTKLQIAGATNLVCANSRQQNLYMGILSGIRFFNPEKYKSISKIAELIPLVPFGLKKEKPEVKDFDFVERKFPGIKKEDKIIFWGGGIWNWFDALSAVKAVEIIKKDRDDIKLIFSALKHPNPKIHQDQMAHEVFEYCHKNNLLDKTVFFCKGWTPYEERVHFLTRASVGISTHFDNLETTFSFRTRILDYLWAELPIVATEGDYFAELIEKEQLGVVVPYEKPNEIANAILEIINNPAKARRYKNNIQAIKPKFYWENCIQPIVQIANQPRCHLRGVSWLRLLCLSLKFYWSGFKKKYFK